MLGLLGLAAPVLPALALGACAAAVVLTLAAVDYRFRSAGGEAEDGEAADASG